MTCTETRDWLGPYLDGEAAPDVCRDVEAHVAACEGCAEELDSLRRTVELLARREAVRVPVGLWTAIEKRSDSAPAAENQHDPAPVRHGRAVIFSFRRLGAVAAVVAAAVGLGLFTLPWGTGVNRAEAATIDFGALLDAVRIDAAAAFDSFMKLYNAKEVTAAEAKRYGKDLNFDIPETLPGGYQRVSVYTLSFGDKPGVAARYSRDGELLGVLFHPPVLKEQFGTHEDRDCIVGKHRGHAVAVGDWSLVHLTDATTCHCVLSRLDEERELPAVMAAVAPGSVANGEHESAPHGHRP